MPRFSRLKRTRNDFIDEQENKNTRGKTNRDVCPLKTFIEREGRAQNISNRKKNYEASIINDLAFEKNSQVC